MEEDKGKEGHVYDGIEEHDHPLPEWWTWTFLLSIIFAFIYYAHYQFGGGPSLQDEYQASMAELDKLHASSSGAAETEDSLTAAMSGAGVLELGKSNYDAKCSACHGPSLQGLIGPNLTDVYWLHGKGTRLDIYEVIQKGVLDKGMPAWGQMLKKEELVAVAAYVVSKIGSEPAGAKPPQGEKVGP